MQIVYTATFRNDLKSQINFLKEEDAWHGTNLVEDLKEAIKGAESYIIAFPDGFHGIGDIRQITLPKFKNHYITYRINKAQERIEFLKMRSFKSNERLRPDN